MQRDGFGRNFGSLFDLNDIVAEVIVGGLRNIVLIRILQRKEVNRSLTFLECGDLAGYGIDLDDAVSVHGVVVEARHGAHDRVPTEILEDFVSPLGIEGHAGRLRRIRRIGITDGHSDVGILCIAAEIAIVHVVRIIDTDIKIVSRLVGVIVPVRTACIDRICISAAGHVAGDGDDLLCAVLTQSRNRAVIALNDRQVVVCIGGIERIFHGNGLSERHKHGVTRGRVFRVVELPGLDCLACATLRGGDPAVVQIQTDIGRIGGLEAGVNIVCAVFGYGEGLAGDGSTVRPC